MASHFRSSRGYRAAGPQESVNQDIRKYFESFLSDDAPEWQSKPEIPSADEVLGRDTPDDFVILNPNIIDEPWPSKEKYLEAHYNLLREDSVSPLRDAVALVRNDPSRSDGKDFSIYESVSLTSLVFLKHFFNILSFSRHRFMLPGSL